jgi:hypothetical protein
LTFAQYALIAEVRSEFGLARMGEVFNPSEAKIVEMLGLDVEADRGDEADPSPTPAGT